MNSRKLVWITGVLLVASILLMLRWNKAAPQKERVEASHQAMDQTSELPQPPAEFHPAITSSAQLGATANPKAPAAPKLSPEERRMRNLELSANDNNVPINFWGRVVDQDGNPLSGVRVVMSVREWFYAPAISINSRSPKTEAASDASGMFQLLNKSGDVMTIEALNKEGYEPEPTARRSFGYNISENFNPNPNDPVVFKMWKDETKQTLVTGNKFFPVIPDGRIYTVDLLKGTLTEGETEGDLRLWLKRSPAAAWGKKYDWSFHLVAVDGGIAEEPNRNVSMFTAPEGGYTKHYELALNHADDDWSYRIKRRFYVSSRTSRLYGRMDVEIQAFYLKDNLGRFGIKYAANPSGGRILR